MKSRELTYPINNMNVENYTSECLTPCTVISAYFSTETVMDDSSSEFQTKKNYNTGPRKIQKPKVTRPKKPLKKIKNQKDIRTLIKNKNSDLVSYSKTFDQVCKKSGVDVDSEQLQLAVALSKSLQETETKSDDNSQESKPLTSQEKTARIRITLQEYGFRVPITKVSKDSNKRKKPKRQYKLLLASEDEKKQIISERYAEVLSKNICTSPIKNKITSSNDNDSELFYKGTYITYDVMKNDDVYYVKDLFEKSKFKYCMLRDWSNIPGRPSSPKREVKNINFENIDCTQDELDIVLSGSIYAAQSIIEEKFIDSNNCDMLKRSENINQDMVINEDNDLNMSTNNKMNDINLQRKSNLKSLLSVSQNDDNLAIASTSNEINNLCTDSKNNLNIDNMLTITQNMRSASPDLFDDDISIISDDMHKPTQVVQENLTQSISNITDCMDLTECISYAPERDKNKLCFRKANVTNRKSNLMEITECVSTSIKQNCVDNDLTQEIITKNENNVETEIIEIDLTQSKFDIDVSDDSATIDRQSLLEETIINDECMDIVCDKISNKEILKSEFNSENKNDDNSQEKVECLPSNSKQNIVENIDLTQTTYSKINFTKIPLSENLHIDLTQTSSYISPLTKIRNTETNNLVDDVILVPDTDLSSDPALEQDTPIPQSNLVIANPSKNSEDNTSKPKDIILCNTDNNSLSEQNNINLEIDLTQTSNSDNGSAIDSPKKEDSLDKSNSMVVQDLPNLPKDSEIESSACNESEENKEIENFDYNHDFYSSDEHFYNDSYYFHDNYLPENNSQGAIENTEYDTNSKSYTESPNNVNTSVLNDDNHESFQHLDKNSKDKSDVAEAKGIDLTQSSDSSNEGIVKCVPNVSDINNLGKIDNVSVDYDELFNDVVSIGSKCTSQTSLNTNSNTFNTSKKAETSNNEDSSPSKHSECFEISDKEFNYSVHQSRHNFDIGGASILDNISDFETNSFKENKRSRVTLNRSFSEGDVPTACVNKICTPKAVFNSQKIISDTSTTPLISKCVIKEVQNTPRNSDYIIKTQNVTPMMDYEAMTSPERNSELEKYGLKPFKRKRAIQLLTHLYEQTHPLVASCGTEDCSSPSKKRKLYGEEHVQPISPQKSLISPRKTPKKSQRSPIKSQNSPRKRDPKLTELDVENTVYVETKRTPDIKEIICNPDDWIFQTREKAKVHSCKVPLHIAFHNYVSCRQRLREAILRYEPVNIDVMHRDLVACGYKYNPKDLLRFLDKKCITVKTADNNTRNRK